MISSLRLENWKKGEHPGKLIACLACQEVEVWMLALHTAPRSVRRRSARADVT
jgi:hypothetical protein